LRLQNRCCLSVLACDHTVSRCLLFLSANYRHVSVRCCQRWHFYWRTTYYRIGSLPSNLEPVAVLCLRVYSSSVKHRCPSIGHCQYLHQEEEVNSVQGIGQCVSSGSKLKRLAKAIERKCILQALTFWQADAGLETVGDAIIADFGRRCVGDHEE
jgi:hypothetical protein